MRLWLVAVLLGIGVVGCYGDLTLTAAPTVAESQGHLDRLVAFARAGDFEGLCSIGDGNCRGTLDRGFRSSVPADPPKVVGTRVIDPQTVGDQHSVGGRVLVVCGTTPDGASYHSELLVFRDGGGLRAINPVYWDNVTIADAAEPVTASEPASSTRPC